MTVGREQGSARAGQASFYLQDDYAGKGPMVILLVERNWTAFLKMRSGFPALPFFSRPKRESEPDTHANGHPWAWLYKPEDALKDEARWLDAAEYAELEAALKAVLHDAKARRREAAQLEAHANEA